MADIDFELDMDELPPVRTFIDGELVDIDSEKQIAGPENQLSKRSDISLTVFESIDESAATELGISLSGSLEDFVRRAVDAQNRAAALVLEAGYLMLKVKASCEHGEFEKRLNAHGISRQRAAELMATAKFYSRLEPEQRKKVFALPKSKLMALAAADPEVVKDLLDDPGEDLTLSVRELRQRIRDMENAESRQLKEANACIETLKSVNELLRQRDNKEYQFHWKTHEVRDECLAFQGQCELAIISLQSLFDDQLKDIENAEKDLRIEQIWITANVIAARAASLVNELRTSSPVDLPDTITSKHMLTDEEAQRWLLDYDMLQAKDSAAKALREQKRIDANGRRPGRPKKDK